MISPVTERWRQELAHGGYARRLTSRRDFLRIRRFSRTWRCILGITKHKPGTSFLEFGCGGGDQLIPLALNGYKCVGIDCSPHVLGKFRALLGDVEIYTRKPLEIELISGDFFSYSSDRRYDCVFSFGVIEHFLDERERAAAIEKKFALCKAGGYVVSVVPNGQHPLRERMRKEGLGGYVVPEIDYDAHMLASEMRRAGAVNVSVVPNNLFGYLLVDSNASTLRQTLNRYLYYGAQLIPRVIVQRAYRHAGSLVCIARCARLTS